VVNRAFPSGGDVARLLAFFAFSWVYLMLFALIGMLSLLVMRRRSLGLLSAMGAWLVITFVVPQFTSGLRPSQSLNPIVDPISTSQTFFKITSKARPFSLAEQFKAVSGRILATTPQETVGHTIIRALPILLGSFVLAMAVAGLINVHDYARSSNE
jgi:ABC-type transport system involved in multi-copper enzyme maturation permease subunit